MADFDSSLPVRTQTDGDVVAKIGDGTTPSQYLAVDASGKIIAKLNDAAGVGITSQANGAQQALDVMSQSNGPVSPGTAASFSDLIGGQYNLTPPTLADTEQAAIQVDVNGRILVSSVSGDDHNYGTVGANTLRTAAQIGNATGAADFNFGAVGAQTLRSAAQIGNATGAADFNAGATGAQTLRTHANQGAPGTAANGWFTKITDGTDTALVTAAGELNVLATAQPGVDIGDVTVNNAGGAAAVNIQDGGNSITVDGTVTVSNFPATVDTNYGTVGASTIRTAAQIGNATGAADFNNGATGAQTLRVAANLAVGGANVTAANPVPVTIEDSPGTHINDYKRAIGVAAGATDNHDYTVTALKTLHLTQIESTGSGKAKMEVEIETGVASGVFLTSFVQFNSTANPNMHIHLDNPISVAAGVRVRIVMKNTDLAAQDMYSTISGYEL